MKFGVKVFAQVGLADDGERDSRDLLGSDGCAGGNGSDVESLMLVLGYYSLQTERKPDMDVNPHGAAKGL